MTTLAEHIIVAGAENHPPMLDKSMYDSWASRILLFIKGKKHGRMMLDSIHNGPLIYPIVEEDGQTRPKKYSELTEAQQHQDDCDVQETNIILHGLPPDVYALVNHQDAAKDIWDKVKLLMKGIELSYQERECKLYNLFDKFASVQGETLYEYYWRFSQLINDMNTIGMTMQQVQVNTKFLNALPPEWSKFVTDVKLVKSLYTTNYDQLHAYLSQHERHANEVRLMRDRYPNPLALVTNSQTIYNPSQSSQHSGSPMYSPHHKFTPVYAAPIHHLLHHTPVNPIQQSVPPQSFISPSITQQPQAEFPQLDSGLAVPTFQQGEDLIECINKRMAFLSAVALRFPPSNIQLRMSSNPINQATIQDGRVTVQQVQGRQNQSFASTGNQGITTSSRGNYAVGQPRVVKCYNCQGEGNMARQCTQPKRTRNAAWFKEKLMLAEAKEAAPVAQQTIPQNSAFQTEDLDAYDSDCDDLSSAKAVLMANLSSCDPDVLSEVPYSNSYPNDMINQDVQEMQYSKQTHIDDFLDNEIHSNSNIIPYSQYLQESQDAGIQDTNSSAPNDLLVLSLVEQMTDHVAHLDKENQTNKLVNESLTAELERYKERVTIFEQRLNVDLNKHEKLIDSKMDDLIRNRNAKLAAFQKEIDTLKETLSNHFKENESLSKTLIVFKTESNKKTMHMLTKPQVFYDATHKQALGYQNPFNLKKAQRIQPTLYDGSVIAKEHAVIYVIDDEETLILEEESRSKMLDKQNDPISIEKKIKISPIDYSKLNKIKEDFAPSELPKCLELETELLKKKDLIEKDVYDKLLKSYSTLEKHCISLELTTQLNQEVFQKDNFRENQNAPTFSHIENELKKLKGKIFIDTVVSKPSVTTAPGMFKLDIEPISHRLKNNRDAHEVYLEKTLENTDTLRRIVECARKQNHIVVTPMNKDKKVRFAEPVTSSSNIPKQTDSLRTTYYNKPLLTSTGVNTTTSASGSKPSGNTKKNRIS
ncbi:hypothetical protein Tco_1058749 [Tanacetum coccineum]|uniref:CCHC-type domain-containing protein n=1 Tax=Tanacetum coccineum TaxID=301880 RepID=A0ABQ5H958_9ASTR